VRAGLRAGWVGAAVALACAGAPTTWDVGAVVARHSGARVPGQRLQDVVPYFAPSEAGLALVLCRWSTAAPIPVWLPHYASDDERRAIERALQAWQAADLGVRVSPRTWTDEPPVAGIVFEILDTRADGPSGTADTIADCAVPQRVSGPEASETPIDAELQYASIQLRRALQNDLGQDVPLTETELLGAVAHELGHALGLPGHVQRRRRLMSAHGQVDAARRWGRRIQDGEALEVPSLAALYAMPSGVRVGWLPLSERQLLPLRSVGEIATQTGLRGPWVRVSAESARILWRQGPGQSIAVVALDWSQALRQPALFEGRLNQLARLLVERSR